MAGGYGTNTNNIDINKPYSCVTPTRYGNQSTARNQMSRDEVRRSTTLKKRKQRMKPVTILLKQSPLIHALVAYLV